MITKDPQVPDGAGGFFAPRHILFYTVQTLEIYATMVGEKTNNTDSEDEHNENNLTGYHKKEPRYGGAVQRRRLR